uniref:Uncharacterized protein n=1 Tax=Cacopsylla melanoneura TaxID=428564 RepID=A0A8D8X4N5_9HEMI
MGYLYVPFLYILDSNDMADQLDNVDYIFLFRLWKVLNFNVTYARSIFDCIQLFFIHFLHFFLVFLQLIVFLDQITLVLQYRFIFILHLSKLFYHLVQLHFQIFIVLGYFVFYVGYTCLDRPQLFCKIS